MLAISSSPPDLFSTLIYLFCLSPVQHLPLYRKRDSLSLWLLVKVNQWRAPQQIREKKSMINLLFIPIAFPSKARYFPGKGKKVRKPSFMFNIDASMFLGLCQLARWGPRLLSSQGRLLHLHPEPKFQEILIFYYKSSL